MKQVTAAMDLVLRGGEFSVYRLRGDNAPPQLLLITAPTHPCPLDQVKREFALTRDLDPTIVVRPHEIVSARGLPALLIDDRGARPLSELLTQPLPVRRMLRQAIGIAQALGHIHEHGLIHCNLRPDTIWIDDTDHVRLTGLGGARRSSPLPGEPDLPAGGPIYVSPEQTGRMNRSIDSRSDLYVLGIILYQMLGAGCLPFHAADPAQWIHHHLVRRPDPLPTSGSATAAIERLIFRLLEKSADDRYQTAADVARDLGASLAAWEAHGHTAGVQLSTRGAAGVVRMPRKLYGRDTELNAILVAYHRAASAGTTEWVLISGYSGAGKSSTVNEIRKCLTPTNGWFISGKFDQYQRDTPFATLAQAFRSLVRQILGQNAEAVEQWRSKLQAAVGEHGELIINLVPDLALVIGEQPPLRDMAPQESRALFQAVLGRFIAAIAQPEHPLVLFLDDLQWLDQATADFLVRLAEDIDTGYLLVIGAYRDNEVDDTHPLARTLHEIRQRVPHLEEIQITPLGQAHIRELVADVLHCEPGQVATLAALIHRKTGGNPFFAIQFFSSLINEQLVSFDVLQQHWTWNVDLIESKNSTENVVDLMSRRLDRLPPRTRKILRIFSCVGMTADAKLLERLCEMSSEEVHDGLHELVADELLIQTDDAYRFVHDRIREAAYRLIDPSDLAAIHLDIARHFSTSIPTRPDALFQIVDHYNLGAPLITSDAERMTAARLNLQASRAAMKAVAYGSAQLYLSKAQGFLGESGRRHHAELAFDIEYLLAECAFLTGAMSDAEVRLQRLAREAPSPRAKSFAVALLITLYTAIDRSELAIDVCLVYLRDFGISWPHHPGADEAKEEYRLFTERLSGRTIESLIDLPTIADQSRAAPMAVMSAALAPAFFTDLNLVCLLLCRMGNISVQYGNCDASALAYAYLGMVVGPCFDDYDAAFRLGDLGLRLVETRGLTHYKARVHLTYGAHVLPWARPLQDAQPYLRRAFQEAVQTGDLTYAGFSSCTLITNRLSAGDPLDDVEIEAVERLELMKRSKFGLIIHIISTQLQFLRSLRGETVALGSLNGPDFDENLFERELTANRSLDIAACWFWIRKMQASYFAGDHLAAFSALRKAEPLLWTTVGHHEYSIYQFYVGVVSAALADSPTPPEPRAVLEQRLAAAHRQMVVWETHNPDNYKGAAALLAAEIARLEGRPYDALRLYQQAASSSRRVRVSQVEATAHELAAQLCRQQGLETAYQAHLIKARESYRQWGAAAKVEQLERNHPDIVLSFPAAAQVPLGLADSFDLAAVVKTSEAVSNELGVPRLMETLMTLVLEHADARRGLLILPNQAELTIRAEVRIGDDGVQVMLRDDLATTDDLPTSLVNMAARTGEAITIDDAQSSQFGDDPYVVRTGSRSLLCLPLMKRNKLIAIIFLENDLAAAVFTPLKLSILKLLSSQAAISLKNALLEEKNALVEALQKSQSELMRMSRLTTIGELVISIAHEINQPLTAIITNADVCLRWLGAEQPSIAEAQSAARRVVDNGRRAAEVVQTIRGLAVKSTPMMSPVDVNGVIREILSLLQSELRQNVIHLEAQLTEADATVVGNRVQLQQVLLNLCMNAVESMAAIKGRRNLTVESTIGEDNTVVVSVTDNGLGFDEERIDQLFEALVTTKPQGMGMGLSISRSIVEAHGGRLWATSVKPHGARFQFALPLPI